MNSRGRRQKSDGFSSPRKSQQTDRSRNGTNDNERFAAAPRMLATITEDADTRLDEGSREWASEPDKRD